MLAVKRKSTTSTADKSIEGKETVSLIERARGRLYPLLVNFSTADRRYLKKDLERRDNEYLKFFVSMEDDEIELEIGEILQERDNDGI